MKPYVPCSDDEYFARLVSEAPYIQGWHTVIEKLEDIEWLDKELLQKTKVFRHSHRHLLAASSGILAAFGIPFKNLSLPFMQTGTLQPSAAENLKRTIKHVAHFVTWYEEGPEDGAVYLDILKIKRMHNFISKHIKPYSAADADALIPEAERRQIARFRESLALDFGEMRLENSFAGFNTYDPPIFLSQFDMVIIQLDLTVAFILPEVHGIKDSDAEEGFAGFLHHWAIIGRLLGIEDRFNLALHPSQALYRRVLRNLVATSNTMDLTLTKMLRAHLDGIALYMHLPMSSEAVMYVMAREGFPDFKGRHLYKLLGKVDLLAVATVKFGLRLMHGSDWVKSLVTAVGPKVVSLISGKYHVLAATTH